MLDWDDFDMLEDDEDYIESQKRKQQEEEQLKKERYWYNNPRYQEQTVAGIFIDSVNQDEVVSSLIQTDMMIDISATAVINGRYINASVPELIDECRDTAGTHWSPARVADRPVKRLY